MKVEPSIVTVHAALMALVAVVTSVVNARLSRFIIKWSADKGSVCLKLQELAPSIMGYPRPSINRPDVVFAGFGFDHYIFSGMGFRTSFLWRASREAEVAWSGVLVFFEDVLQSFRKRRATLECKLDIVSFLHKPQTLNPI